MSNKIIALVRVSTMQQDLDQQRISVVDECHKLGYEDTNIIVIEDKESAVKLSEEERNGLRSLKDHITADDSIKCVITYELSRISRRASVIYSIRDFLIAHNVQLIVMNPYFKLMKEDGTLSETSNIFFGIFGSMAENEGFLRKARFARGKAKNKELGLFNGGHIRYGYTVNNKGQFVINEAEAEVIRYVYTEYATGRHSTTSLGKELKNRGWCKYQERTACSTRVWTIINWDGYDGCINGYPAIISTELKMEVKRCIEANKVKKKSAKKGESKFPLTGIIRDKETGYSLSACTRTQSYINHQGSCSVRFELIHPIVWEECKKQYRSHTDNEELRGQLLRDMREINIKYAAATREEDELRNKIDYVEERLIMGKISQSKADEIEDGFRSSLKEVQNRMKKLKEELFGKGVVFGQIDEELDDDEYNIELDAYDVEARKKLIKKVIKNIYITKPDRRTVNIEIHNYYNNDVLRLSYHIYINNGKGSGIIYTPLPLGY